MEGWKVGCWDDGWMYECLNGRMDGCVEGEMDGVGRGFALSPGSFCAEPNLALMVCISAVQREGSRNPGLIYTLD